MTGTGSLTLSSPTTTASTVAGSVALTRTNSLPSPNTVQTLNFSGTPAGTFTLTFNAQTTGNITYSSTFTTLQANILAALAALPTIGLPVNLAIGGTATSVTITFMGTLANVPQNVMTYNATGLTAGGITSLTITTPATTLNSGTLILGANNAISGGILNLIGGTLQATTGVTLPNSVNLNTSNVTLAGSNPIVFSGIVSLAGLNNTITVANTALTAITGPIVDNTTLIARSLTKLGTGTLTLSGTSTYSAQTNILAGTVNVQSTFALGNSITQPSLNTLGNASEVNGSGTLVGPGATLQLQGGITVNEALALNGGTLESLTGANTYTGPINLNILSTPSTVLVDVGQLTVVGQISGTADLTKAGGGTLILNGANTYTGQTNVNAGILTLGSIGANAGANVFGAVTGSIVVASDGTSINSATLQVAPRRRYHLRRQASHPEWAGPGPDCLGLAHAHWGLPEQHQLCQHLDGQPHPEQQHHLE